ncbi:LamG-like jellyroll fold domain-containing protein [Barnesiella sp. An55]|uniref:LamG-like jellyroll fold domain-containing protein n=1 Tax=Barnesiella sp. An55 TaxID=1965646 RepID=UPI000B37F1EA|nr:LamG-like jellyroll fold domain-containing protein [Barnesiella sp. An55]OUN69469.1 phage tail protein [Barnesiella sp. An55]
MALEQNLILNIPFDEANGSTVAYDFAQNRHDATVTDCSFVSGKQGNCIHFDGAGRAEIESNIVTLSGNFTILAWLKSILFDDGYTNKRIGIFCNTDQSEGGYREAWIDIEPGSWGYFAIRKAGNQVSIYLDTQLIQTLILPSTLTGIAIVQDVYSTGNGYGDLDELKVYNVALSENEIAEELNSISQLEYYLNGVNFKEFDLHVESSTGVLDLPKLKTPTSVDWADYHGKVIDLTDKRYQEREITLNCWLRATGKMDFTEKVNRLYEHFRQDGTQRLMISIHPTKPLVYEVYCEDGVAPSKRWHDDKMIGTFSLKLKEPDPVKRVIRHQRINASNAELTIELKSDKMVNVYWGDGTVSEDIYGDYTGKNALKHTYADNGIYYTIVAGVIEEITDFDTNGIVVWNRL